MGNGNKLKLSHKFQLLRSRHWLGGFQDIEALPVPSRRGVLPSYMPRHGQGWRPMQDRRRLWVHRRIRLGQGLRTMRRWVHLPDSLPGILKWMKMKFRLSHVKESWRKWVMVEHRTRAVPRIILEFLLPVAFCTFFQVTEGKATGECGGSNGWKCQCKDDTLQELV